MAAPTRALSAGDGRPLPEWNFGRWGASVCAEPDSAARADSRLASHSSRKLELEPEPAARGAAGLDTATSETGECPSLARAVSTMYGNASVACVCHDTALT